MPKPTDPHTLQRARTIVYRSMPATPQYRWPLLARRLGATVWVKHENHTPTGAFKVRGGLVYFDGLMGAHANAQTGASADRHEPLRGVACATRGNHGQSVGFAARAAGLAATIVVPHGNSVEKNAAMRGLGVTLIEHGEDFQSAREHAGRLAAEQGLHMVPSFHPDLVSGVASYWLELFEAEPAMQRVYVPIGLGSGACAAIAARDALGLRCEIVGVVSSLAPSYALSLQAGRPIEAEVTTKLADGMACRVPEVQALEILQAGLHDLVQVDDEEIARAMKMLFVDTHNVAEGAGAAALAAAWQQRGQLAGKTIGLTLCGGNVDHDVFASVLTGTRLD